MLPSNPSRQQQPPSVNNIRARHLPVLPSFVLTPVGQSLVVSILSIAKSIGFENTLVHGKRVNWFKDRLPDFFGSGGVLHGFRLCTDVNMRRKFKEAKDVARQKCVRRPDVINDNLISTFNEIVRLKSADAGLIAHFEQKLNDLLNERERAIQFHTQLFARPSEPNL